MTFFQLVVIHSTGAGQQHRGRVRGRRPPLLDAEADDHDRALEEVQVEEDRTSQRRAHAGPGQRAQEDQPSQAEDQGHDVPLAQG